MSFATSGDQDELDRALFEFDRIWDVLEQQPTADSAPTSTSADVVQRDDHDQTTWHRRVKDIRALIRAGRFQKIVTARTATVESETPFDEHRIMKRLATRYPGCTQFAFRWSGAAFIGATPETLFAKQGNSLRTHALAGSVRIHPDLTPEEAGAALLRSRKNREEHAVVVRQILDALQPLVEVVEHDDTPRVMRLQKLLHLETPIHARLTPTCSATKLLSALHPTPAVAGLPRAEAMRWITANEPPRGWYTGPVGWVDTEGDGEFAVAIRCALIEHRQAHAFAGAGIMHDSDPPMEYAETNVKLQAMLEALGVRTEGH